MSTSNDSLLDPGPRLLPSAVPGSGNRGVSFKLTRLLLTRDGCQVGMQSLNSSGELRDFPSNSIDLECDLSVMVVISCEVSVASARVIEKRC